jgi:hypothetical protein
MRRYWRFYWPLALTAVAMGLSVQFQNATLARYPAATRELATLALAWGAFGLFNACLQFVAQLSNVYARSPFARRRSHWFVGLASVTIAAPVAALALLPAGAAVLGAVYGIEPAITDGVQHYLAWFTPLILLNAQRFYYTGLLVQAELTGRVTVLNVVYLCAVILGLVIGFRLGGAPVPVIAGSELGAATLHLVLVWWVCRRRYRPPLERGHEHLAWSELVRFFVGVSTTGVMFAVSRPILFAYVARNPNALVAIAALRVTFDFTMLFQQAANQFRHFFVTFGWHDLAGKRRFMAMICGALTAIMLLFAVTPLAHWVWGDLMGIPTEVVDGAVGALLVMCLMPLAIIYRNYFHGRLMIERRTGGMALGGVLRVAGIWALASLGASAGWLDERVAAWFLVAGFAIEAAGARYFANRTVPGS